MIHASQGQARQHDECVHDGQDEAAYQEIPRQDRAFLDRQRYRLELARDTLVRELANGRDPEGQRPEGSHEINLPAPDDTRHRVLVRDLETMLERKLKLRLMRTVRALEKIEEGTYGVCDVTGKTIARERLEQVPEDLETVEGRRRQRMTKGTMSGRH